MKRAIISDIHGNLEALQAVLSDIDAQNVDSIYCLGDVIGYGANPLECIDLVRERCEICILGNHDQGALFDPDGFNANAEAAIYWTREQLEKPSRQRDERWDFLNMRPRRHLDSELGAMFVHGSPKNPLNEYVFPHDAYSPDRMDGYFNLFPRLSFQGHTHVPGIFFFSNRENRYDFREPEMFDLVKALPEGKKYMINVGSVGQPRDANPRACYVLLSASPDETVVEYRRVEYPVEAAAQKIFDVPQLDNFLGERIKLGR